MLTGHNGGPRRDRATLAWRKRRLPLDPLQAGRVSALLGIALVAGLAATLAAPLFPENTAVEVGRPSPRDFKAPRSVTYPSQVLTDRERDRQARAAPPIFEPTDTTVGNAQAARARVVLRLVARYRDDDETDRETALRSILAIPELSGLSEDAAGRLLDMDDATWETVRSEVPTVVAQTLREPVRPDTVGIARTSIISYVERSIDTATSSLISQVAAGFIVANTAIDEEKTAAAREAARETVEPVVKTVAAGQTIIRAGDIVTPDALEVMAQLGLLRGSLGWRDVVANLMLAALLVAAAAGSLARLRPGFWRYPRRVALMVLLILGFVFGARFAVLDHLVLGFAYPAAAAAMTTTVLLGIDTGIAVGIIVAAAVGALSGTGLEPAVYILAGGLAGSIALGRVERLSVFLAGGAALAISNLAVVAAFRLPGAGSDFQAIAELSGAAVVNAALATGLCAVGFLSAGALLGLPTTLQLLELARPDQPLLRELQLKAPGTYQHSIVLSNLAESAAQAIGANTLLVRVGAYYHDVGKTKRPYFFVENQPGGANLHENLDAFASARIIISHVPDGAELCRDHGVPDEVTDFVWEHHGTTRAEYFYRQAVDLLGEEVVDAEAFRYPGPRPRSRETAILMLADGSEAAVRAADPESAEEIRDVVSAMIRRRLNAGELDDSNLTLRDLKEIRRSFVDTLRNLYHPRIKYPDDVAVAVAETTAPDGSSSTAAGGTPGVAEPGSEDSKSPRGPESPPGQGAARSGAAPEAPSPSGDEEHIAASVTDAEEPDRTS